MIILEALKLVLTWVGYNGIINPPGFFIIAYALKGHVFVSPLPNLLHLLGSLTLEVIIDMSELDPKFQLAPVVVPRLSQITSARTTLDARVGATGAGPLKRSGAVKAMGWP